MAEITKELGRIPVSRGDYQATIEYYKDNIVQYKRGSYQVVSESPIIGVPPTNDKNVVNPGWILFAGTLDAQDVVNQIKEQEAKSVLAVANREAEILAKSDASLISANTTGLSGINVQDNLNDASKRLVELEEKKADIEPSGTNSDLDITDENFNVIARFKDGHIKTKEFDSRTSAKKEDIPNNIALIEDASSDLDVTDEDGNVIARFKDGHIKTKNFDSSTIDTPKSELDLYIPDYVFGIESGFNQGGREFFTNIYPEALAKTNVEIKLNGNKKCMLQKNRSYWGMQDYVEDTVNVVVSADGYKDKSFDVKYIRTSRKKAQNKPIRLLVIGDSITEQHQFGYYVNGNDEMGGAFPHWIQRFALEDNEDIGSINFLPLGTRYRREYKWTYDKVLKTPKQFDVFSNAEGRASWGISHYLNSPIGTGLTNAERYYLAGLATMTPFDSNIDGRSFVSADSYEYGELLSLLYTTPMGRYKPNWNEALWEKFKMFSNFTGTGSYNSSTSDVILSTFWENVLENPEAIGTSSGAMDSKTNPFFYVQKARAYTGNHNWTHKSAFSIDKWLERYRNMDNSGNYLNGSAGQQVTGIDGNTYYVGTKVTNENKNEIAVCKPTHIIIALGMNDGDAAILWNSKFKDAYTELLNQVSSDGTIKVGYFTHRKGGVLNPNEWQDCGYLTKFNFFYKQLDSIPREIYPTLDATRNVNYIPVFFTESPISGDTQRPSYDLDDISGKAKIVAGSDEIHTSAITQRSIGYQCLAWIYWTLK